MTLMPMTDDEWEQLLAIRAEMNANMMALSADDHELYTELLVKSLAGKGNEPIGTVNRPKRGGLPPFR